MKQPVKNTDLEKRIFAASANNFEDLALDIFQFQYQYNEVYQQFCNNLHINPEDVITLEQIPFLPIRFFKTHRITTTTFKTHTIFESSGTTTTVNSKHYIKDTELYRKSFMLGFEKFYGSVKNKCILGLLPSYLERNNSSLVYMVEELIKESKNDLSGFYLYDYDKMYSTIVHNEILKQDTIVIGVTYALLDFAAQHPLQLRNTIIMETGGMKGRKEEMTRQEVHARLQSSLGLSLIHSEYGMTELLSQAYSKGDGIFHCPAWMKVILREEDDPFALILPEMVKDKRVNGAINVIDLANLYSCSFIATDDIGRLHNNESFEVLGRMDNSDIRGCSLMSL